MNSKTLDIVKGISLLFIVYSNAIDFWLIVSEEINYVVGYVAIFCGIFGPLLFVLSYSFETIFILQKIMGSPPEKPRRNKVIRKGFFLILLGFVYNGVRFLVTGFSLVVWGWNMILYIGFAQIIVYFSFKLIRWARLAIGLIILFVTPYLREMLYLSRNDNLFLEILHFIVVSPDSGFSLLPYASLCFFTSIFSELVYQAKVLESKKAITISIKSTVRYGFIFILAGFLQSLTDLNPLISNAVFSPLKYPFIDIEPIIWSQEFQFIPFMPEIFLPGTIAYVLFTVGLLIATIGLIFYLDEVKGRLSKLFNALGMYGNYSLTIVFTQYLFIPLFLSKLDILLFFPISTFMIVVQGYLIYIWNKYAEGKGSIDWIVEQAINLNIKT